MQPLDIDFDADITADEMQMMQSMGIPFGFDTTQVSALRCFASRQDPSPRLPLQPHPIIWSSATLHLGM